MFYSIYCPLKLLSTLCDLQIDEEKRILSSTVLQTDHMKTGQTFVLDGYSYVCKKSFNSMIICIYNLLNLFVIS